LVLVVLVIPEPLLVLQAVTLFLIPQPLPQLQVALLQQVVVTGIMDKVRRLPHLEVLEEEEALTLVHPAKVFRGKEIVVVLDQPLHLNLLAAEAVQELLDQTLIILLLQEMVALELPLLYLEQ
jgi:hypothetical protein